MSFVASRMKMTEMRREKISSVNRVKKSTMLDSENTLPKAGAGVGTKQDDDHDDHDDHDKEQGRSCTRFGRATEGRE